MVRCSFQFRGVGRAPTIENGRNEVAFRTFYVIKSLNSEGTKRPFVDTCAGPTEGDPGHTRSLLLPLNSRTSILTYNRPEMESIDSEGH